MSASVVWAAWSDDSILIFREGRAIQRSEVERRVPKDFRHFVKLSGMADGRVLLRTGSHDGSMMDISTEGAPFASIEGWPCELSRLPVNGVRVSQAGTILGNDVASNEIFSWSPPDRLWLATPPAEFLVTDVAEDPPRHWICGSLPARQLRSLEHRAAFAVTRDDADSWEIDDRAHGRMLTVWGGIASGALGSYRNVYATAGYVLLTALTRDLGDETTLVFLRTPEGNWRSKTLRHDIVQSVVLLGANDGIRIVSHYGKLLFPGRLGWMVEDLRPPALRLLEEGSVLLPANMRLEILDAQALMHELAIVVSLRTPRRGHLQRFGEAVVVLGGSRDRLVAFHAADEPEVVSAALA